MWSSPLRYLVVLQLIKFFGAMRERGEGGHTLLCVDSFNEQLTVG